MVSLERLEEQLKEIQNVPIDVGTVELIVRRPADEEREVLAEGFIDVDRGLVGDIWHRRIPAGLTGPDPEAQLTVVNAQAYAIIAGGRERWPLAGDQLFLQFDISEANVPSGSRLQIGTAVIEFSQKPHTGCKKFSGRFGLDALRFVSTPLGKSLRLRGANCRVVQSGVVRVGDLVRKVDVRAIQQT